MDRKPRAAGTFYPAGAEALSHELDVLFSRAIDRKVNNVRALISPHAGYVFSGKTAASAYNQIPQDSRYEHVFIIATSHHSSFGGVSVFNQGNYLTPLGTVTVDTQLANELIARYDFMECNTSADFPEHSIEVQLPFLQKKLAPGFKIVPLIVGTTALQIIEELSRVLEPFFNPSNLLVVSTDFSHYPPHDQATDIDKSTARAICSNNTTTLLKTLETSRKSNVNNLATTLCGWTAVLVLMGITRQKQVDYHMIDYAHSGDSPVCADKSKVVGYHAIAVCERNTEPRLTLDDTEKRLLLETARAAIAQYLANGTILTTSTSSPNLDARCGAFVSIHEGTMLRGCIGSFVTDRRLVDTVVDMAIAAATRDTRFERVKYDEIHNLTIEISVITPLVPIKSINEIIPGIHGIYIKKGNASGTFLPQVATHTGWNTLQLLGHCARDKAGLGWEGWKDAELFIYEAIIFND